MGIGRRIRVVSCRAMPGAGGPGPGLADARPAGLDDDGADARGAAGDPRARAGTHPPVRLRGEPGADGRRVAPVLQPGGLVAGPAGAGRARGVLRRGGGAAHRAPAGILARARRLGRAGRAGRRRPSRCAWSGEGRPSTLRERVLRVLRPGETPTARVSSAGPGRPARGRAAGLFALSCGREQGGRRWRPRPSPRPSGSRSSRRRRPSTPRPRSPAEGKATLKGTLRAPGGKPLAKPVQASTISQDGGRLGHVVAQPAERHVLGRGPPRNGLALAGAGGVRPGRWPGRSTRSRARPSRGSTSSSSRASRRRSAWSTRTGRRSSGANVSGGLRRRRVVDVQRGGPGHRRGRRRDHRARLAAALTGCRRRRRAFRRPSVARPDADAGRDDHAGPGPRPPHAGRGRRAGRGAGRGGEDQAVLPGSGPTTLTSYGTTEPVMATTDGTAGSASTRSTTAPTTSC